MGGIKALIVLSVTSFHFAIVSWSIGTDQFVPDAMLLQMNLKHGRFLTVCGKAVGKFRAIIRLDAFNGKRECFYQMIYEHGRGISIMFLKSFHEAPSGILVNSSILEELFSNHFAVHKAGRGNKFHINLDTLTGMIHLFIGFWNILGIGRMNRYEALFTQETVKTGNGTGIPPLHELYPEHDQTGIRITSAHIHDKLDLRRSMLVRMVMRSSGEFAKGLDGAVKASFPAVDVLPVGFVFNGSVGDTIFFSISEER